MTTPVEPGIEESGPHGLPEGLEAAIAAALPLDDETAEDIPEPMPTGNLSTSASLIIASGGQDVPPEEVIAWIAPLLRGLPADSWFLLTLMLNSQGVARASCIGDDFRPAAEIVTQWPSSDQARFRALVPAGEHLTVVLLEDGHSQLFALLDVVSDWLCRLEPGHCDVQSLFRMIGAFEVLRGR